MTANRNVILFLAFMIGQVPPAFSASAGTGDAKVEDTQEAKGAGHLAGAMATLTIDPATPTPAAAKSESRETLFKAVMADDIEAITRLMDPGVMIDGFSSLRDKFYKLRDADGNSILHLCIRHDLQKAFAALYGMAQAAMIDLNACTNLYNLISLGRNRQGTFVYKNIQEVLVAGISASGFANSQGDIPYCTLRHNHECMMRAFLLRNNLIGDSQNIFGADVLRSASGLLLFTEPPIHAALYRGCGQSYANVHIIKLLLDNKAAVNACNSSGETLLHRIFTSRVSNGKELLELLLKQSGINVNAKNNWGMTPLALARLSERLDLAALLEAHGALDSSPEEVKLFTAQFGENGPTILAQWRAPFTVSAAA